MADVKQFKLPDVGEGLTEAELVTWKVKVGDTVKINDVIVEIETAKSLVELPSPYAGTVAELLVDEGTTVDVGTPIISISSGDAVPVASTPAPAAAPDTAPPVDTPPAEGAIEPGLIGGPAPGGRTSVLVGYGPRTTEATRRPRTKPAGASPAAAQQGVQASFSPHAIPAPGVPIEDAPPAAPAEADPAAGSSLARVEVLAKPPVRQLAKQLGVDLNEVAASGPNGTVSRADVEAHADSTSTDTDDTAVAVSSPEREQRIPIKGVRKVTAQAMVASAFTAPHVTEWITIDATRTMRFVERLKKDRAFADVKVSPLLVVAKAVCLAVRRTPTINASWDEAAQEIVLKNYVNLGIAAATPRGLLVPNVKDADQLDAHELAVALQDLTATAREGKTAPADQAGGTFTITNVGVFGVDAGTPILNPGESGILAMGVIREQPWIVKGKIKPRWVTTLSLSFDHRMVDGEQGSRFLADVAAIVEDPGTALLM